MTRTPDPIAEGMRERLRESSDQQPMTAYCALCPDWRAEGTAREARSAAYQHRKDKHPGTLRSKPKRPVQKFSHRNMTAEREEQIDEERRLRLRALGLPPE